MKIFALSTAEPGCSLAVSDGDTLVCDTFWHSRITHSRRLLSMAAALFPDQTGFDLSAVDGFVAARGPGSFTGLRIGISAVMGMAVALSRPAAGVSSLDGIAFRFAESSVPVCVMMDARRGQVYCAAYWFDRGRLVRKTPETVCPPDQAVALAAAADALFAGSGARVYQDQIACLTRGRGRMAPWSRHHISAAALICAARMLPDFFSNPANTLAPAYIRAEGPGGF
ncbi:MAG TPA: tRNA (adenosine(37)-N6)-threonylcarbamoyltransferase complex dimerization subunit type 1 TsaB [Desulfotignum sp.]|nr:tRNA (adenosine(37)-N6)-threonylcarbamoyltransferase complex dimerization subunit type 1 TsaB [Desulfotignum sp.]